MNWLLILGLTFSSSIDNLGVGISYGIRKIQIRLIHNLLIAVICFLFSEAGILFGLWISSILPGILPVLVGSFLLFIIGIRIILLAIPRKKRVANKASEQVNDARSFNKWLGNSSSTDSDQPTYIGFGESIILGIALSANALTNGLGAGLLGLSPHVVSILAAIGSFVCVWLGVLLGVRVAKLRIGPFTLGQFGTLISGVLLLVIAYGALF